MAGGGSLDPEADHAGLVDYLRSIGFSDEVIAQNEGRLVSLASRRVLFGDEQRIGIDDVAAATGCTPELVRRVRMASGLPDVGDAALCSPREIEVMQSFLLAAAILGEDISLQFTRVLGNATSGIAEAALATFQSNRQVPMREGGADLADVARAGAEATTALLGIPPVLDVLLRLHFDNGVHGRFAGEDRGPMVDVAVAFVDLVESTRLTLSVSGDEFAAALSDFERDASDAVVVAGGRIVKRIGDAVMFVTSDPARACDAARTILTRVEGHPTLRSARAAVARGYVLPRDGDYFGPAVNLAARAVPVAAPGTIVVTDEVRAALPAEWDVHGLGAQPLKGFDEAVELFVARQR